jgi:hypothetical protein
MPEYLFFASIASLLLPLLATWHRDRVKDGHNPKVRRAIRIWAVCSILVIALSGANVYESRKQSAALRVATQELEVLRRLSQYRIEVLDSYFQLFRSAATVRNFVAYEAARNSSGHAEILPSWQSRVSNEQNTELAQAKSAFERTQRVGREILIQKATYPSFVPKPLYDWAAFIVEAKFEQVTELIDPYNEGPQSVRYAKLLGDAIGAVTGAEIEAAQKVTR